MLDSESDVIQAMNERIAQSFLDLLILLELRKKGTLDDNDVFVRIQNKFQLTKKLENASTVLELLEKNGLVAKRQAEKASIFTLTGKGLETVNVVLHQRDKILGLVLNMLSE